MHEITVNRNDAGQRLDKFMQKTFRTMPVSLIYKYIRKKSVRLNGKHPKENAVLTEGDVLAFYISDEFFSPAATDEPFRLLTIPPVLAYEDENILILDKPAGLLVHAEAESDGDTLIDRVKAYLWRKGEYDPANEHSFAPALANRIDRNTQGLVLAAKNAEALRLLSEIVRERFVEKRYLAVCHGFLPKQAGELRSYLEKNAAENRVYARETPTAETRTAVLRYRVLSENRQENLSLLEIELVTGRTHQIRVQLADAGCPLLGDGKYAVNRNDRKAGYNYQALCSYAVTFRFPPDFQAGILAGLNGLTVRAQKPKWLSLFPDADAKTP